MSVTELRDEQANEWEAWARNNPDDVLAHNKKRRDELAKETSGKKVRLCEFVSDEGVPCVRAHTALGLCMTHWAQQRKGRPLTPIVAPRGGCDFMGRDGVGCNAPHVARGFCRSHYRQWSEGKALTPRRPYGSGQYTPRAGARNGEPWTEWEFDLAMSDTPLREVALRLGRTYSSVVRARQRRRRMLGLGIEYTKSEAEPYDGSDRRGVLYQKDKK